MPFPALTGCGPKRWKRRDLQIATAGLDALERDLKGPDVGDLAGAGAATRGSLKV